MGFSHYTTQKSDFAVKVWRQVCDDVSAILRDAQHVEGIALAGCQGLGGTQPEIHLKDTPEQPACIAFNGVGEDAHETFVIDRRRAVLSEDDKRSGIQRGWSFCKTARKPYDAAVTACLAYLESIHRFEVTSDGDERDWELGVRIARRALPHLANQIQVPARVRDTECAR